MKPFLSLILSLILCSTLSAQDTIWTLQRCIEYAHSHNISIQQGELDKRLSAINLNSSKANHYPTFSMSSNYGLSLGRSINPTTNQFENTRFSSTRISASSNVLLFGWFQKKYAVQKSNLALQQTNETYEQLKDDISLNISTAYLRALLAMEQIDNISYQIDLSQNNKSRIEKLLAAGKSNILEQSQAQTQLATDSSQYLQAVLNYEQAIIELKALLNFDFSQPFELDYPRHSDAFYDDRSKSRSYLDTVPPHFDRSMKRSETEQFYEVEKSQLYFLEHPNPETIYNTALDNNHNIKANEFATIIAAKDLQISKANSLPQLSFYYSTGTNYSSSFYEYLPSGEKQLMNFGKQLNTNWSHSFGLSLGIPIFNNLSSKNGIKTANINLQKSRLSNLEAQQKLKQDIYAACTEYELIVQKYQNAQSVLANSQTAYNAAQIRYEAGLINYFELLTEKNNYLKSQNEATAQKYELWFKKLLVERFTNSDVYKKY